jgi:hypothetical protein
MPMPLKNKKHNAKVTLRMPPSTASLNSKVSALYIFRARLLSTAPLRFAVIIKNI